MKNKEKQFRCFRCQELLDDLELKKGPGHHWVWKYCDNCYDHMFISWRDVFSERRKNEY